MSGIGTKCFNLAQISCERHIQIQLQSLNNRNCQPSATITTPKPDLQVPHPDATQTLPEIVAPPLPCAAHSFQCFDNPFSEKPQLFQYLAQIKIILSHPFTWNMEEEMKPHLSTVFFQVIVESNEVSSKPLFLHTKQSQWPQLFLIRLVLQILPQLYCAALDTSTSMFSLKWGAWNWTHF